MPVTVDVRADELPEEVELAAYFIVSESLTNASKHAAASRVAIDVERADDALMVQIADDGRGGADTAAGTALRGLVDRIDALGGQLEIDSPAGRRSERALGRHLEPLDVPELLAAGGRTPFVR
jgi:signal transduction histidine kinase